MNTLLQTPPKPTSNTMKQKYHLIIEETNLDTPYFEQTISVILVNTDNFTPIIDISSQKKYQQNIIDMVTAKYGDDVKIYYINEQTKGGKSNVTHTP